MIYPGVMFVFVMYLERMLLVAVVNVAPETRCFHRASHVFGPQDFPRFVIHLQHFDSSVPPAILSTSQFSRITSDRKIRPVTNSHASGLICISTRAFCLASFYSRYIHISRKEEISTDPSRVLYACIPVDSGLPRQLPSLEATQFKRLGRCS